MGFWTKLNPKNNKTPPQEGIVDLHVHSVFSDGTDTPEVLARKAHEAGLRAFALTDHDSVEGIARVSEAARAYDIEIVPGIELTAEFEGMEIHVLGFFMDISNKELLQRLEEIKQIRIERANKMVDKLQGLGIELDRQRLFAMTGGGTISRLHIARALVEQGKVASLWEAFNKYLGDHCPGYVLGFKLNVEQAAGLISSTGGIPILAHPYVLGRDDLLSKLVEKGIRGLEVFYPEHSASMVKKYRRFCRQYDLLMSGGSDYHGEVKPDIKLGALKIPYSIVETLRSACPGK
jgi:hypothetical protein